MVRTTSVIKEIRLKIWLLASRLLNNPKSSELTQIDQPPWLPINVLHNHGPISYRFRDKRVNFSRKSQMFPTPCILRPADGVPLGTGYWRLGSKTRMIGYQAQSEVWRYFQSSGYNTRIWQTDRQTNRRTPADSKDSAYASHIASRGKTGKRDGTWSVVFKAWGQMSSTRSDFVDTAVGWHILQKKHTYKILFRRVDIEVDTMFDIRPYAATRGHQWKLSPAFNGVDVRKHFFR